MTVADLSFFWIGCLTVYAFLLAAACLLGIVRAFNMETGFSVRIFLAGMLALSVFFMQGLESVCIRMNGERVTSWIAQRTSAMPVWFVLTVIPVLTGCVTGIWIVMERQIRMALTPASLQEGLDYMPDGISFSTDDGIPLLVNRKMQNISYAAFGTGVLDMRKLRQRLETGDLLAGCHAEYKGDAIFLHLQDESVWDIQYKKIPVGKSQVRECIAYDITEQYQKSKELEKRNEHLVSVNEKIREYNRNLDSVTRDREILQAKIKIHDNMGRSLLALRSYLSHNKDGDRKSLVDLWRFTIAALKREGASHDRVDRMETLAQAAQAVGVKLVFEGEIPKEPAVQEVAAAAIHECLTNTVKHADGSKLTVYTGTDNKTVTFEIKNNGKPPAGPVEEKGGLRTLRMIVKQHGGKMEIISEPEFLLRIRMRLDEKEEW